MVLLRGTIAVAQIPQLPFHSDPMFGVYGGARASLVGFISPAGGWRRMCGTVVLLKQTVAVQGTRGIGKANMILNDACPEITATS